MAAPSAPGSSGSGQFGSSSGGTVRLVPISAGQVKGKKRATPGPVQPPSQPGAKKRRVQPGVGPAQLYQIVVVDSADGRLATTADVSLPPTEPVTKPLPFKDPKFVHSGIGGAAAGKKNRTWKNLKQILAAERALPWKISDPTYYNIDAPPSMKPPKKYSDISGLPAHYTDPQTKLRFTSPEEFSYIRLLPTDVVTGYLTLRKATCIVP